MSEKLTYLDCWSHVAAALFSQALADEPALAESSPQLLAEGSAGFVATIAGDQSGCFTVFLDVEIFETTLLGEGMDQRAGWLELLREVANSAVGELLAKEGVKLHVESFEPTTKASTLSRTFQLTSGERCWTVGVSDEITPGMTLPLAEQSATPAEPSLDVSPLGASASAYSVNHGNLGGEQSASGSFDIPPAPPPSPLPPLSRGLELLLDVELEASLRFGSREMPLGEILDLGPGDVVQLDRHIADPVDLIIGDKIVARGEVVLVNGNFALRVTEVAEPRRRLESIRCLF